MKGVPYMDEDNILGFFIGIVVVAIIIVVGILMLVPASKSEPRPCSYYANYRLQSIPARCVKEFTE